MFSMQQYGCTQCFLCNNTVTHNVFYAIIRLHTMFSTQQYGCTQCFLRNNSAPLTRPDLLGSHLYAREYLQLHSFPCRPIHGFDPISWWKTSTKYTELAQKFKSVWIYANLTEFMGGLRVVKIYFHAKSQASSLKNDQVMLNFGHFPNFELLI